MPSLSTLRSVVMGAALAGISGDSVEPKVAAGREAGSTTVDMSDLTSPRAARPDEVNYERLAGRWMDRPEAGFRTLHVPLLMAIPEPHYTPGGVTTRTTFVVVDEHAAPKDGRGTK